MKPSLIPGLLGASLALFGSPAFAQQDAPAAKKKQQRVVIKEQSKANEELLKKAAELSAKASELAAAGDSQAAARAAAKASALLQEAANSQQNKEERQRIRIEREKTREDRRLAEETRRDYERALVIEGEKAHQHGHDHDHDHNHQHGEDVEKEVRVRIERAHEAMDRAHAEMEEHRVHIENLHERMALLDLEEGDHQIWVTPQIEELADGQLNLRIATELEELNELDVLHTDLADAQAELRVRLGELHEHEGMEGAVIKLQGLADLQDLGEYVQLGELAAVGEWAEMGDVAKWVEVGDLGEFEVNIERLADVESMLPGLLELHGNAEAYALALPGGQHGIQGWVQKDSDCEGECDCECEERELQVQAYAFPGGQGHARFFTAPEANVEFGWSTEAPKAFSQQGNRFFHHGGDGEHEVHVFRSGEGGEIEIHGGNGHQTIIIEGRVIMNGQPMRGFEWNTEAPTAEGRYLFETDVNVQPHALFVPQPPKAPKAPKAPLATPRVRFHGQDGEARVLQGRIVPGEDVNIFETEDGQEVRVRTMVRPQPKDASAPAPSKAGKEDMQKLVEEMRAEMEALRQELSDLRRQMKDDPLVQAQRRKSTERNALAVNPVAALSDRRRAGLDR